MPERWKDKVAIVVGAGCTPGETIGNGRATAILFARGSTPLHAVRRAVRPMAEVDLVGLPKRTLMGVSPHA